MREDPKIHPTWLYHPTLAPEGKIFHSPEETKGLWRKGWVDTPAKFPKPIRGGVFGWVDRYHRLSGWNRLGVWGSVASIVSLGLYFWPSSATPRQNAANAGDQSTILQAGRDLIVQQPSTQHSERVLPPQQVRLLELVAQFQKTYAANRLIVSREDGTLHFDDNPTRVAGVSLVQELFGQVSAYNAGRFDELVHAIPGEYLRVASETRWGDPFVLSITEAGLAYVAKK